MPLSPSSRTVASVAAARCSCWETCRSVGSSPNDAGSPATLGHLFLEQEILGLHAALSDGALDQQQQVVGLDWLGEEVGGTLPHGGDGVLDAAVGGHHDDRHFRVQLLGRSQHAEPVAGR